MRNIKKKLISFTGKLAKCLPELSVQKIYFILFLISTAWITYNMVIFSVSGSLNMHLSCWPKELKNHKSATVKMVLKLLKLTIIFKETQKSYFFFQFALFSLFWEKTNPSIQTEVRGWLLKIVLFFNFHFGMLKKSVLLLTSFNTWS